MKKQKVHVPAIGVRNREQVINATKLIPVIYKCLVVTCGHSSVIKKLLRTKIRMHIAHDVFYLLVLKYRL